MSRRALPEESIRVGMHLYKADLEQMKLLYPAKGVSSVIRTLIRTHLLKVDSRFREIAAELPDIELLDEEEEVVGSV